MSKAFNYGHARINRRNCEIQIDAVESKQAAHSKLHGK